MIDNDISSEHYPMLVGMIIVPTNNRAWTATVNRIVGDVLHVNMLIGSTGLVHDEQLDIVHTMKALSSGEYQEILL